MQIFFLPIARSVVVVVYFLYLRDRVFRGFQRWWCWWRSVGAIVMASVRWRQSYDAGDGDSGDGRGYLWCMMRGQDVVLMVRVRME